MSVRYTFDPRQSRFTVQAFAGGMLRMFAHNPTLAVRDFSGTFRFTPDTFENASVQVTVKAASLEVTDELSPRDREEINRIAREQVLEAPKYPEVKYESDEVAATKAGGNAYRVHFKGKLSLHGTTKDHEVDAQLTVLDDTIRLSGSSMVKQSEFGIKPVKAVGGMIAAKDEVKVAFDIVGRRAGEGG